MLLSTMQKRIFHHSSAVTIIPPAKKNAKTKGIAPRRETGNTVFVCICLYVFHQFIPVGWKLSLNICADTLNLAETVPIASRS